MRMKRSSQLTLVDQNGHRKYLSEDEKRRFLLVADKLEKEDRMFSLLLFYTGCRPLEALELTYSQINFSDSYFIFRCAKKRKYDGAGLPKEDIFRAIPVPRQLMREFDLAFDIQKNQKNKASLENKLFKKSRTSYYRKIKLAMKKAGVKGIQATAKGLRHSYAITLAKSGLNMVAIKKLMGHTDLETTEIYMQFSISDTAEAMNRVFETQQNLRDFNFSDIADKTVI